MDYRVIFNSIVICDFLGGWCCEVSSLFFPFSHLCVKRLDIAFESRLLPQLTGVRALFWRCLVAHSLFLYKRLFRLISFILFFPVLLGVVDFTIVFLSLVQIVFKLMFISLVYIPLYLFFVYLKQLCVFCGFHSDCVCLLRICIPSPNRLRIPA